MNQAIHDMVDERISKAENSMRDRTSNDTTEHETNKPAYHGRNRSMIQSLDAGSIPVSPRVDTI